MASGIRCSASYGGYWAWGAKQVTAQTPRDTSFRATHGVHAPLIVQETVNLSLRGAPATKQSPMAQVEIASLRSQ